MSEALGESVAAGDLDGHLTKLPGKVAQRERNRPPGVDQSVNGKTGRTTSFRANRLTTYSITQSSTG